MSENWTKIRVLQYLLFKQDRLDQNARESFQKIQNSKKISDIDLMKCYKDLLYAEFFNDIFVELVEFL